MNRAPGKKKNNERKGAFSVKVNSYRRGGKAPVSSGSLMLKAAAVLLCLVMFSTHLMGGLYARYTATGTGEDSARVAAFNVDVSGSPELVTVSTAANEGVYTVTVENDSEVAVAYSMKVTAPTGLGFAVDVKLGGVTEQLSADELSADFGQVGQLAVGPDQSASHDLSFSVADWDAFTKNATGGLSHTSDKTEFTVTVDVVQID